MTRPLAVLRPEPGNGATCARIEALGRAAIRLPLFEILALDWTPPGPHDHDALLVTSANAMRFGGAGLVALRNLPVLAVGARTADAVRATGFDVIETGESDARVLLARASAHGFSRVLHLGGRDRSIEVGGAISRAVAVYASAAAPVMADQLRALGGTVALLHSARAAARLGALLSDHGLSRSSTGIAAISPAVVAAAGPGWATIATAAMPTDAALIKVASARD